MRTRALRIVTIGAAFSANKGAAAMLETVIRELPRRFGPCDFRVLTTYPDADKAAFPAVPEGSSVTMISYRPVGLVLLHLPCGLLTSASRSLGVSGRWACRTSALRAIHEADLVVDLAGISFADGRGIPILSYNMLMTGIPLLAGAAVVKCAQALGPFRNPLTRLAATVVLPRLEGVVARGELSEKYVRGLSSVKLFRGADLTYALGVDEKAGSTAEQELAQALGPEWGPFHLVIPSSVVQQACARRKIPYISLMAAFIRQLVEAGEEVLLVPHAARPGRPASRMNDIPLVEQLHHAVDSDRCKAVPKSLNPTVLKGIVQRAEFMTTCRFHGLIAALSVGTPSLVIGWSHKYDEALSDFGLEDWAVDYRTLTEDLLYERYSLLKPQTEAFRASVIEKLPELMARVEENFRAIEHGLGASR